MPDSFHARKSAVSKEYRYRLLPGGIPSPLDTPFAVRVPPDIDLGAMQQATLLLVGRYDFTAFALAGGGHGQPFRRVLKAEWKRLGEALELHIVGDGFLRGMVRSIVGTLLEVGRARISCGEFEALLRGRPRREAGPTAPAHGLVLQTVHYGEEWGIDESSSGAGVVLD